MAIDQSSQTPTALLARSGLPRSIDSDLIGRLSCRFVSSGSRSVQTRVVFTGKPYVKLPQSTEDDVCAAVNQAAQAQNEWARTSVKERARVLRRFCGLVLDEQELLLDLIQAETGKARWHAYIEALEPVLTAGYYVRKAAKMLRPRRREAMAPLVVRSIERRQPHGVVGIVAPWNYPFALGLSDALTALIAGNAVVLKPDTQTALSPIFGVELLYRSGLPEGLIQVVLGEGSIIGSAVVDAVDYIAFTGSTQTGRHVGQRAAGRLVGCSLELGGKNALLVLDDADLGRAVEGALQGCFMNAGQVCMAIERIYVHRSVYREFLAAFVEKVARLRLRASYDFDSDIGSLTSQRHFETVSAHVEEARTHGATIHTGGRARPDVGPFFYEPTVLTGVTSAMRCGKDETFGPVVAVYPVDSDAEAIAMANDTEYGLSGSVYTANVRRGRRIAGELRAGAININDGFAAAYGSMGAPMGGMGISGLGRRHGEAGLLKYTEAQTVASQRLPLMDPPRWISQGRYASLLTFGMRALNRLRIR